MQYSIDSASCILLFYLPINGERVEEVISRTKTGEFPLVLSMNVPSWVLGEVMIVLCHPGRIYTHRCDDGMNIDIDDICRN